MQKITLCGSTGSIGTQTLEVIAAHPHRFQVVGLAAAGTRLELLAEQVVRFRPAQVAITQPVPARQFAADLERVAAQLQLPVPDVQLFSGPDATLQLIARPSDLMVNAITGAAGLLATLRALERHQVVALANKESLVIGGHLVLDAAAPGQLISVDSEHSAIAQALRAGRRAEVAKVILTASGGPFRGWTREQLRTVTPAQALHHPTWHMGRVITINSATLVNKGLEVLEAHLLFGVGLDDIQVVVHPQSIVHSGVEFFDGASILQASPPDMKLPIGLALTWPERLAAVAQPCDWTQAAQWTFEPLDDAVFPAVELARRAGHAGGSAPAVFNAANEVAVDAFCAGTIGFLDICDTIAKTLDYHLVHNHIASTDLTLEAVLGADEWARAHAARTWGARSAHSQAE